MFSWLPLPVACLRRRSLNAKNPRDRHDTAYYAWEMSVRLAVAVRPPAQVVPLARGSVGHWVRALAIRPELSFTSRPLLELFAHLAETGRGRRSEKRSVTGRELVDLLPAYRNKVIGHGSARATSFYEEAGSLLLDALDGAWEAGLFLPTGGRVVYCETVWLDPGGRRLARLLDMTGLAPLILDPRGTAVSEEILPKALYWQAEDSNRPLSPWLFYHEEREALYAFNGLGRRAEYLDFASGHILRGRELAESGPELEEQARALFTVPEAAAMAEEESPADEPDRFGEFRIQGKLGEGGMGVVYLARQESLGREVALKLLPPGTARDPVARARFRREVEALSRCEHPNVIKILTSGEEKDVLYYAMEYVEGTDMAAVGREIFRTENFDTAVSSAWDKLREERGDLFPHAPEVAGRSVEPDRGQDRYRDLARYFRDAARGVHHLHEQGIIHRDLKPGNLMVTVADRRAVVMDLGLAAVEEASIALTRDKGQILGTLRYLPPEQLQRNLLSLDRRADIYSLGASFYELLCLRPLFDGDTEARLIEQILREEPARLDKVDRRVPRDLAVIVHKAIDKDPKLRYESAEELTEDIEAFLAGRPIKARPPTLGYLLKLTVRRNKKTATVVAAALLVIVVATAWFMQQLQQERVRAEESARAARRSEEAARGRLQSLKQLSTIRILEDLRAEANRLWPEEPGQAGAMRNWLGRAATMAKAHGELAAALDRLRQEAIARPEAVGERPTYEFTDDEEWSAGEKKWRHDLLSDLVGKLEYFFAGPKSLVGVAGSFGASVPEVRRRLARAESIHERSVGRAAAAAWRRAIGDIARPDGPYGGLELKPQVGLTPLDSNPRTGLWEFWHLPSGERPRPDPEWRSVRPAPAHPNRWLIEENTGMVFVLLPGGSFVQGAQKKDPRGSAYDPQAIEDEGPPGEVVLGPFFISKYEMTQAQYFRFVGENRSHYSYPIPDLNVTGADPAENEGWDRFHLVLSRLGLALPTEAQWEYACRAGSDTPWWTGRSRESLRGAANLADRAAKRAGASWPDIAKWPDLDDGHAVHAPVGSFRANGFGLHDTHGNVWEWCRDWYVKYDQVAPRPGDALREAATGRIRVYRGGSFFNGANMARASYRTYDQPAFRSNNLGVRPVREVASD